MAKRLTDPVAGPAIAVLHTQPGRDWTIPSLAAAIGKNRRPASLTMNGLRILVSGRASTRTIAAGATGASAAPRSADDFAVMSLLLT